jgi:uncharacterized protein YciW
MRSHLRSPSNLTVQQLLERERSLRLMASTALTVEELTALLTLVEHYELLVAEHQSQEKQPCC